MTQVLNHWLFIAGNGRHVGKTWMAEQCIAQLAPHQPVAAIKIAPHYHAISSDVKVLAYSENEWLIGTETNAQSAKDSGRMLNAGATAYYVQTCHDQFIPAVVEKLLQLIAPNTPVICESAAIGLYYTPGAAIYIADPAHKHKACPWTFEYLKLTSNQSTIIHPPQTIVWEQNSWQIR